MELTARKFMFLSSFIIIIFTSLNFLPSPIYGGDILSAPYDLLTELSQDSTGTIESPLGKVKIIYEDVELYSSISRDDIFLYPSGPVSGKLRVGEIVELLDSYSNDYESGPSYKIKSGQGKIYYIKYGHFEFIEPYGDRGAIYFINMSTPYEYEGNIELVDNDIKKYKNFLLQYSQSKYKFQALKRIASLHA